MDIRAVGWSGDFSNHRFRRCVVLLARSGPWQAWMEGHFRGERAGGRDRVPAYGRAYRGDGRPHSRGGKCGCGGFGLRQYLPNTGGPDAGQRPINSQAWRLICPPVAARAVLFRAVTCRYQSAMQC